jgi:DNA polymerase-1
MTHLLVDGDIVLYSSSVATEHAVHWNDDVWVLSANLEQARDMARKYLDDITEKLEATKVTICLSGKGNFRYGLNPNYKSNRKDTRKPIVYPELKHWMLMNYGAQMEEGLEADDLLGILATRTPGSIIVSPDKDMQCIPGKLYRQGELMTISLEEANRFHMMQTLTGDATDGYPGCPGVGPKTAEKLLAGPEDTWWGSVLQAYQKAGCTDDDALMNARMAYILRDENWQNGEVKLWNPK